MSNPALTRTLHSREEWLGSRAAFEPWQTPRRGSFYGQSSLRLVTPSAGIGADPLQSSPAPPDQLEKDRACALPFPYPAVKHCHQRPSGETIQREFDSKTVRSEDLSTRVSPNSPDLRLRSLGP